MKFEKAPPQNVELLDRIVGSLPGTVRRPMFGYAAYFAGGNLAVGLFADGICMRLSDSDRAAAFKVPGVEPFAPMQGRVMKEYAFFTKAALGDEKRLAAWAKKSVQFTLEKPKK
jgi:hypothetical protein